MIYIYAIIAGGAVTEKNVYKFTEYLLFEIILAVIYLLLLSSPDPSSYSYCIFNIQLATPLVSWIIRPTLNPSTMDPSIE